MCQEILQDDELKKNFLAEAPNGHSVRERAWEMQQKNINSFVKNYVMENIVDRLTQENDCLLDQNRMLCELNQQASTRINDLEDEIKDLRGDNDHLRATINDLHLQEDDLISQVNHLNACLDEKAEEEEELEMEKENAPLHNKLFDLLKAELQVDVSVETKEATFNIKSKDTPAKFKAKTPKRSRVPRTPASMPRAAASMPRPASAIPRESID